MEQPQYISGKTVTTHTPYNTLINAIADAFTAFHDGNVKMPDKTYVPVTKHNGDFRSMPAYINADNWEASGVKWVNVHPDNTDHETVMGTVIFTDPATGKPLAILDGTALTKRRTAAASAIATHYLTPETISCVGVLGAGTQAYEQIRALETIRDFDEILISDINSTAVDEFINTFDSKYTVRSVTPETLSEVDLLYTTTPSESPIIEELFIDGIHINAMGADAPEKQELAAQIPRRDDCYIIVDDYSQAMHSGEISSLIKNDELRKSDIHGTLGDVITGDIDTSVLRNGNTIFDSTGLAIQDIATAYLVYCSTNNKNTPFTAEIT